MINRQLIADQPTFSKAVFIENGVLKKQITWSEFHLFCARSCFLLTCFSIPLSTTGTDIFFALSSLFVLLSGVLHKQAAVLWQLPAVKVLSLAVIIILIGFIYTWAPLGEALKYSKKYLWLLLTPLLFVLNDNAKFRTYAICSFVLAMIITLIFSYLNYLDPIHFSFVKGKDSIFKDHIIQNFLMSITALIFLLRLRNFSGRNLIYFCLFLLVAFDILFLCEGRIGYVLLPALIVFSFVVNFGWRKVFIPCLIILFLFSTALRFSPNLQHRLYATEQNVATYNFLSLHDSYTSLGIRRIMWGLGIKIIEQRPWFGYGTGSIHTVLNKIPDTWIVENHWLRSVRTFESSYLNIGIQFGLFGLGLFALACIYLWRQTSGIQEEYWRNLIRGMMLAMMIGFFFNPWLESTTEKHLFAVMLILCFPVPLKSP